MIRCGKTIGFDGAERVLKLSASGRYSHPGVRNAKASLLFAGLLCLAASRPVANESVFEATEDLKELGRCSKATRATIVIQNWIRSIRRTSYCVRRGLFDGVAEATRIASRHWQHDVRAHAFPEYRVCARSGPKSAEIVWKISAQAGSFRHPGDVLRHRQSRSAVR